MTAEEFNDLLLLYENAPESLTPEQLNYVERLILSAGSSFEGEDDPEVWARRYYSQTFTRPFTKYQREFWGWGFGVEYDSAPRPRVECEPRGVGKSTGAETLVVRWLARRRMSYVLYVSATDDQAAKHLKSIKRKLEAPALLKDYPHLAPRIEKYRNALSNWSGERLVTADGQVVECISLLGNARGFKTDEDSRIDAIVLDDIDSSKDSPHVVDKKLMILRDEILPAGDDRTVVLFAQNLIHRDSICAQVLDHRADILSRRHFAGPYPLMKWYDAEKLELPDGSREWKITAGEAHDPAIDITYCESLLNQFGRRAFDRECQQLVNQIEDDKDFREWDEIYHVITRSEMADGFARYRVNLRNGPRLDLPDRWNVGQGFDWGTTREHPAAVATVTRPDQTTPFDDSHFVVLETVLPAFPYDTHAPAELVSPGRVAAAVKRDAAGLGIVDGQVKARKMSHEASAARNTLIQDLPDDLQLYFNKWQASRGSGVAQIQNLLEIDYTKPHPFRRYPAGHPQAGEPLMGRPRIYFVVEDGQGELYVDGDGKMRVRGAVDSGGFARARFEIPLYSQFNSGQNKRDDDFVDALRGLMSTFGVAAAEQTPAEKRAKKLAPELQKEVVEQITDPKERDHAEHSRRIHLQRMEQEEKSRERAAGRFAMPKVRFRK